jgi:hypothetical protein
MTSNDSPPENMSKPINSGNIQSNNPSTSTALELPRYEINLLLRKKEVNSDF